MKIVKGFRQILLPAFLLVLLCAETAFGYTTTSYTVDVEVGVDNSYLFTETIDVDYDRPQHGIYRYIPLGAMEGQRSPRIDREWVDGWTYQVYEENGNEIFQIGDADRTVTGAQTFTLGYRMRIVDDKDTTKDFLYTDVLPTNWDTPIEQVAITVRLPKPVDADSIEVYAGRYGSETLDGDVSWDYDEASRTIEITGRDLSQGEGITILCDLPEGYWEGQLNYNWTEKALLFFSVIAATLMLALWLLFGRDPHLVPTVEFYPPQSMTPAEVGYVLDGAADKKDLISMILYFADQGWLAIEQEDKKTFILHKKSDLPTGEKKFARTLFNGIFAGGDCVTGPATVIRAIAAGKVAAANIDEHLGFRHEIKVELDIPAPRLNNRAPHGRINTTEREACERRCDFEDIECGLTEEGARTEASRCLRCDHYGYGIFRGGRNEKW